MMRTYFYARLCTLLLLVDTVENLQPHNDADDQQGE